MAKAKNKGKARKANVERKKSAPRSSRRNTAQKKNPFVFFLQTLVPFLLPKQTAVTPSSSKARSSKKTHRRIARKRKHLPRGVSLEGLSLLKNHPRVKDDREKVSTPLTRPKKQPLSAVQKKVASEQSALGDEKTEASSSRSSLEDTLRELLMPSEKSQTPKIGTALPVGEDQEEEETQAEAGGKILSSPPAVGRESAASTAVEKAHAPKNRFFFLHLPSVFFSAKGPARGRITAAKDGKETRKEAPSDITPEEMRALRGEDARAGTMKQEQELANRSKEKQSLSSKKDGSGEELRKKKSVASEEEAPKEAPEPPPRIREGSLKRSGFREFLAAVKHFGLGHQRALFTGNLATMLNAGLSLIDSLQILRAETKSRAMKKLIVRLETSVEGGSPLWRAMDNEHFFTPDALALIRIGEEAGNLAKNMEYLAVQQEKDRALRQKVKMAMIYPAIVLTLMFVIVMGLGLFVLPNLIQVLYSLNVELPLVTRLLILFTNTFTTYAAVGVPAMIGGMIFLVILAKFTPLRIVTQWVLFRIPGIGRLAREATIARFGVILGGLLQAGVPLVEAIHSLADVTPIASYRRFYLKLLDHVSIGDSFAKSFSQIRGSKKILPVSVQQLVTTGEKSGSLAAIMLKVADIYEKKANETAQKLPIILEPMILLIIGSLVGTIAFAIIVPIYSIVGSVGRT